MDAFAVADAVIVVIVVATMCIATIAAWFLIEKILKYTIKKHLMLRFFKSKSSLGV